MIRFAKPTALFLCAAVGLLVAAPSFAQQSSSAKQMASAKKPAKGDKSAAADKSGDAGKGKPLLVASFGDWGVYQTQAAKGRVCYTLAQPKDRAPADLKRDAAYAFISDRPGEGVRNEISFIMGFDVANPPEGAEAADPKKKANAKEAVAMVGDQSFELLAKTSNLWVKNAAKEGQLIDEMRKSGKLLVKAASKKGNVTTDTYSLAGFSQALDRVQKDCPSN